MCAINVKYYLKDPDLVLMWKSYLEDFQCRATVEVFICLI